MFSELTGHVEHHTVVALTLSYGIEHVGHFRKLFQTGDVEQIVERTDAVGSRCIDGKSSPKAVGTGHFDGPDLRRNHKQQNRYNSLYFRQHKFNGFSPQIYSFFLNL